MQKSRISRELRDNEVYVSPMKNLQQSKVSREIQVTSYEWARESEFESTDSDSSDSGTLKQVLTLF